MVRFFESYSSDEFLRILKSLNAQLEFVQTETAQLYLPDNKPNEIVQFETAQFEGAKDFPTILSVINWTNHVEILMSCKSIEEQLFYIMYAHKERFEVKELKRAIKTNAYAHIVKHENNQSQGMQTTYPKSNYLFKDVAYLDF